MKNEEVKAAKCRFRLSILNSQFLICFALAIFCSAAMADSLRLKFTPGDAYSLVSVTEQKMSRLIDGNELSSEQTTRLECDLNVEDVDENGNAWTRYTYKHVVMKMQSKEQKFDFDSDANALKTPIQVIPFQLALGESIYLRITPQGHIEKINGLQPLIASAKGKMGSFPGEEMVRRNISRQFDEPAVRRELEGQFAVFPDSNNEGAVWTRKEVLSSGDLGFMARTEQIEEVNIVSEKTFQLGKSGQGGISVVDVNLIVRPQITQAANAQTPDQSMMMSTTAKREITGDGTGQVEIENATGRIISNKMTQDTVERVKLTTQNQMRRPISGPEPIVTHRVMTFQMTKVAEGKPAQPADVNKNGS